MKMKKRKSTNGWATTPSRRIVILPVAYRIYENSHFTFNEIFKKKNTYYCENLGLFTFAEGKQNPSFSAQNEQDKYDKKAKIFWIFFSSESEKRENVWDEEGGDEQVK
uniref:Uncharacterized protein n=1 Tax=Caenorhabditis japonica TaxID=281687 RepID=A0A8R1IE08_CAEJA